MIKLITRHFTGHFFVNQLNEDASHNADNHVLPNNLIANS